MLCSQAQSLPLNCGSTLSPSYFLSFLGEIPPTFQDKDLVFHLWEAFFHKYSKGIDILSSPVRFKHESVNYSSCNPRLRPLYFRSSLRIVTTVLFLRSVHDCEVMDLTPSILRNTKIFCTDLAIAPEKVQLCGCAWVLNL